MAKSERERTREREREPIPDSKYEQHLRYFRELHERQDHGKVVIKPSDRQEELTRQGRFRFFLDHLFYPDTPLQEWRVFTQELRTHSGKHRHQGGIVIYVIDGTGYSVVEGERINWKKGDLLLLPLRPGGIEHQHFNSVPGTPAHWIAFIHNPIMEHLAHEITHIEDSPEYGTRS
jgi:quercetin dioxygenase-like cupin family protein